MLPPAPARFSTTTCWPSCSPSGFCRMRAVVSVPPPGSKPTTTVTGLLGYAPCASAPYANGMLKAAASTLVSLLIANSPPRYIRALPAPEHGLALFHEGFSPFGVIGAVEAFLHQGVAHRRVVVGLHYFADDALGGAQRERGVRRDGVAVLARQFLELGDRDHAVYQAHLLRLGGTELAGGDHDFFRVGGADDVDQLLHRPGPVAQAELRRGNREARVVGRQAQGARCGDAEAPADAVAANHRDDRLVEVLQLRLRGVADLLVALHRFRAGALVLELRDVGAGDEGPLARPCQHDDADRGIGVEIREHARDRLPHGERHRVAARRIVEDQPADRAVLARVDPRFAFRLDAHITLRSRMPRMSLSE